MPDERIVAGSVVTANRRDWTSFWFIGRRRFERTGGGGRLGRFVRPLCGPADAGRGGTKGNPARARPGAFTRLSGCAPFDVDALRLDVVALRFDMV